MALAVGRGLAIPLVLTLLLAVTAALQAVGVEVTGATLPRECELFVPRLNAKGHTLRAIEGM